MALRIGYACEYDGGCEPLVARRRFLSKGTAMLSALFASISFTGLLCAESHFELGFEGPGQVNAAQDAAVTVDALCLLRGFGDGPGAQAWSFGVIAAGARITDITT